MAFGRIDSRNFAFDEADPPINQRLAYIDRNVIRLALSKCKPDQRWIEKEFSAARHERYLVVASELFRKRLGDDYAPKAASCNQDFRH